MLSDILIITKTVFKDNTINVNEKGARIEIITINLNLGYNRPTLVRICIYHEITNIFQSE